jgi:hypothetical protein
VTAAAVRGVAARVHSAKNFVRSPPETAPTPYVSTCVRAHTKTPRKNQSCERGARPLRVAALVSGGVDSSVALHLLRDAGHDVTAFYLQIWFQEDFRFVCLWALVAVVVVCCLLFVVCFFVVALSPPSRSSRRPSSPPNPPKNTRCATHTHTHAPRNFWDACPWEEDLGYARAVCDALGVPLRVVPLTDAYWARVVAASVAEIKAGRTPNPDVLCNSRCVASLLRCRCCDGGCVHSLSQLLACWRRSASPQKTPPATPRPRNQYKPKQNKSKHKTATKASSLAPSTNT